MVTGFSFFTGPGPVDSQLIGVMRMPYKNRATANKQPFLTSKMTAPAKQDYVTEKMTNALLCLATHPGDVRCRLVAAHHAIRNLRETDFPAELQEDWRWVIEQLTRHGPGTNLNADVIKDPAQNTMARVQNKTGVKIAERIMKLYWATSNNEPYR